MRVPVSRRALLGFVPMPLSARGHFEMHVFLEELGGAEGLDICVSASICHSPCENFICSHFRQFMRLKKCLFYD